MKSRSKLAHSPCTALSSPVMHRLKVYSKHGAALHNVELRSTAIAQDVGERLVFVAGGPGWLMSVAYVDPGNLEASPPRAPPLLHTRKGG